MSKDTVILVVDDDHAVLESMQLLLEEEAHCRAICAMGARGADRYFADREPIDVIVADVILSGQITGFDICRRAREIYPEIAVVVISADPSAEKEAMPEAGVYLRKAFGGRELLAAIGQAKASVARAPRAGSVQLERADTGTSERRGLRGGDVASLPGRCGTERPGCAR